MEIIILLILVFLNGFFALAEIALVSSKQAKLEQIRAGGSKGAVTALKLLGNSEKFLSAIQVGITLIGIVTGMYGGMSIADDITPFFKQYELIGAYADKIALFLTVLLITFISIVLGELVPKTIALSNPEGVAVFTAPLIYKFSRLFYPIVNILSFSTNIICKILRINKRSVQMTEADLRMMIKIATSEGVIEKAQNLIHEKVFYFADKKAKHIMTHRTNVDWIDLNKPGEEIKTMMLQTSHSKIVCCRGTIDSVVGIVYLKDYFQRKNSSDNFVLDDIIVEPLFVLEYSDAQKVLELLRQKKTHICCVVNEYGGFEGLITLYDIIENIVGEVPGEGETHEPDIYVRDEQSTLVSGEAPIETLSEIIPDFTVDFEKVSYSTVAGFVINKLNKIPQLGDKLSYNNHSIEIVDIDGNKIDKVLITKKK